MPLRQTVWFKRFWLPSCLRGVAAASADGVVALSSPSGLRRGGRVSRTGWSDNEVSFSIYRST